jgi:hypothetical protein
MTADLRARLTAPPPGAALLHWDADNTLAVLAAWLRSAEAGQLAAGSRKLEPGEAAVVRASLAALADAVGGQVPLMPTDPNAGVPDAPVVPTAKVRRRAREVATDGK